MIFYSLVELYQKTQLVNKNHTHIFHGVISIFFVPLDHHREMHVLVAVYLVPAAGIPFQLLVF